MPTRLPCMIQRTGKLNSSAGRVGPKGRIETKGDSSRRCKACLRTVWRLGTARLIMANLSGVGQWVLMPMLRPRPLRLALVYLGQNLVPTRVPCMIQRTGKVKSSAGRVGPKGRIETKRVGPRPVGLTSRKGSARSAG